MNVGYGNASDTGEGYHIEDWSAAGDGTQVVLAAGQIIPLEIASTNKDSYHNSSNPDEQDAFEGNQIILNSDRIVFNAKTYLGNASTDEAEPVALGQTLVDWMQKLCDTLLAETHPTACGPSGTPINAADYSSLKSSAPDILSQNSFCTKTN